MIKVLYNIKNWFKHKSPCCNMPMSGIIDMELNCVIYTCPKCSKKFV